MLAVYQEDGGEEILKRDLPDGNLLDCIHDAASRHAVFNHPSEYTMDGSALLVFGVIAEEMIKGQVERIIKYQQNKSTQAEE